MPFDAKPCKQCRDVFSPTKANQEFCKTPGRNCRQNWHKENSEFPGEVFRIMKNSLGSFTVTIRVPNPPRYKIGDKIAVLSRPDASTADSGT